LKYEIQLKGAGKTPFTNRSDGRSILRSTIREYLGSLAMHNLNISTTRPLSLITSSEIVKRGYMQSDNILYTNNETSIICRVSPSFIRVGQLEL